MDGKNQYRNVDSEVLYADNHLVVAAKPCDMLTQPNGEDTPNLEEFVKTWIKKEYHKPANVFLHAIHRLDRVVSGLVLFARTSKALARLNEQSRLQEIQRVYLAEVEGVLSKKDGQLDHFLIHGDHRAIVAKKEDADAKHARLYYKTVKRKPHSTLVEIELETGRYHQIRVQFSAIGNPVIGDQRYGSHLGNDNAICLHGKKLAFEHPVTKELLTFETPAPFD